MRGISFSKDATACAMDLVLIIDRSASIEDEFGKQLAFAVDLVDRVMDDDLTAMTVRVGVISFSSVSHFYLPITVWPRGRGNFRANSIDKINISQALLSCF